MDLDEVAHNEPPHQDLRCLQIQLFSSLVLKELRQLCINIDATLSQAEHLHFSHFPFPGTQVPIILPKIDVVLKAADEF